MTEQLYAPQKSPMLRWSALPVRWVLPITLIVIVLLWQALLPESGGVALILPRPNRILEKFVSVTQNGLLIRELGVTALEIFLGFSFGVGIAFGIGYSIAHNRLLEQILAPYLVGFQALPIVAIAPALILWLGPGLASNSVICAFIVFFPMLMSTVVGIKTIDADRHELFNSWAVTRWNRFRHLEFPGALPSLFGGLKVSVILAVAGAVVAESVTPIGGIGSLLYAARSRYDSALAWVAVFTLTAFALTLYGAVNALERRLLRWRRS